MEKDILALISRENNGFSKGQKQIAKYELTNVTDTDFAVCENASAVWSG